MVVTITDAMDPISTSSARAFSQTAVADSVLSGTGPVNALTGVATGATSTAY